MKLRSLARPLLEFAAVVTMGPRSSGAIKKASAKGPVTITQTAQRRPVNTLFRLPTTSAWKLPSAAHRPLTIHARCAGYFLKPPLPRWLQACRLLSTSAAQYHWRWRLNPTANRSQPAGMGPMGCSGLCRAETGLPSSTPQVRRLTDPQGTPEGRDHPRHQHLTGRRSTKRRVRH